MTSDELAAICAHVARRGSLTWHDGGDLLAEVDRLTAENATIPPDVNVWMLAENTERARALPNIRGEYWPDPLVDRAAVLAAIKGETTK